jgi:membrane associated rhomboid family serine protease
MGIHDRDYYRQERRGFAWSGPRTIVATLVLLNVALFLVDGLFARQDHEITKALALRADDLTWSQPWRWVRLLTYGFVHHWPPDFTHILFNMLGLWFLGRDVESLYGRKEFLRLYLALILVGGLVWAVAAKLRGAPDGETVLGASGAVVGVVLLYALNFPHRTLILFPLPIPVRAWVVGVFIVGIDLFRAISASANPDAAGENRVAYAVHLAGAAFAFFYFRFRWNLSRFSGGSFSLDWLKSRPKLRLHEPPPEELDLNDEVDRILEKIHRDGEASLTRKERRTLETASREYQKRRQGSGRS